MNATKNLLCLKCDEIKPVEEFYKSQIRKKLPTGVCISCQKNANRNWRMENGNGQSRNWENRGVEFTVAEFNQMLVDQDGKCAICEEECETGRQLALDHNHKTGKKRGLLCFNCNVMLGKANDDPARLMRAALYLQERG